MSNVTKQGQVKTNTFYEEGDQSIVTLIAGVTYTPAANTNNSCRRPYRITTNKDQQYIVEADFAWNNMGAGTGGTYRVALNQNYYIGGTATWSGDIIQSMFPNYTIMQTGSGTFHGKALWKETVQCDYREIGIRTDYSNGSGSITFSNFKISPVNQATTLDNSARFGDTYITVNELIEY